MAFMDMMPWRRGRSMTTGTIENVRGLMETMERALEEPWQMTGARLLGGEWSPRMELRETEKEVVVEAAVPDLDKKDLHISACEDAVSIRGSKRVQETDEQDRRKHGAGGAQARYTFYRSFTLPATVRPDEAKATYRDGVLTVTLPKAKHSQVRKIPIA